jgi:hypothetical protein
MASAAESLAHLTFWNLHRQQVVVSFDGGQLVQQAGLLPLRHFEKQLGILADLARRLPDPRAPEFVHHSLEALLTQRVYQFLAGFPDDNDAQSLRHDPLFQTLVDVSPDAEQPLASGSTLARMQYAYTRRQQELPEEDRPAFAEMYAAQTQRIPLSNDFLVELFIRTRRTPPAYVIIDLDPTDDPAHGEQSLAGYHGYYQQHQYFPLLAFDGDSGFPLAAWLRPGRVGAACGSVDVLHAIVTKLRAAWPGVLILVRGDNGVAGPEMYEYCEAQGLLYAFGYASNAVLQRRTQQALDDLEVYYACYGQREPHVQRFEVLEDYQADGWSRPRRIVAKVERTPQGSQRRFVVTNQSGHPRGIYRGFYVQRGAVPEQPIGELKNGLQADRLSATRFRANAWRLLIHVVAYAVVVLFREAAAEVPEVATATVSTLRQRLWNVAAWVETGARHIGFHVTETGASPDLWGRVQAALTRFVVGLRGEGQAVAEARAVLPM